MNNPLPQVFAFAQVTNPDERLQVHAEIQLGKSRFGMWDQVDSLRIKHHGKNAFLLSIRKGDWIVHINSPKYGECVAVQATGEYEYDQGIDCGDRYDFHNYIPVNPSTATPFSRRDPNVLPSVNLQPMRRGQRISQVQDFLTSLENLKTTRYTNSSEARGSIHLKQKIDSELLPRLTQHIQEMHKSKEFERFLEQVFNAMPQTASVKPNGFGWGTDNGADLIVEFKNPIPEINRTTRLVVQAKSYTGNHYSLEGVNQIVTAMEIYEADSGLLITTANKTEELECYIRQKAEDAGKPIDLIAGADVAKFVIRNAPDMLI